MKFSTSALMILVSVCTAVPAIPRFGLLFSSAKDLGEVTPGPLGKALVNPAAFEQETFSPLATGAMKPEIFGSVLAPTDTSHQKVANWLNSVDFPRPNGADERLLHRSNGFNTEKGGNSIVRSRSEAREVAAAEAASEVDSGAARAAIKAPIPRAGTSFDSIAAEDKFVGWGATAKAFAAVQKGNGLGSSAHKLPNPNSIPKDSPF